MFKLLREKIFGSRLGDRTPAPIPSSREAGARPISIFEDDAYKVKSSFVLPTNFQQKACRATASVYPQTMHQAQLKPSPAKGAAYGVVQDGAVPQQKSVPFEHIAQEMAEADDPRAAFLEKDANDPNAPAGYFPHYRQKILEVVDRHADTLVRKFKHLIIEDDYGTLIFESWNKEANYFIDRVLRYELGSDLFGLPDELPLQIVTHRVIALRWAPDQANTVATFDPDMSGHDYEHFCADLLSVAGWKTRVTKSSGDQGVDIEATKDGVRAVFQCKKYSAPVGNSAVQEVLAGKTFYGADVAVVVSNASFTPAAKHLALSAQIRLVHHDELSTFEV